MMKAIIPLLLGSLAALQAPGADDLRSRLDAYLLAYEPQLSALVADEEMTQRDGPSLNAIRSGTTRTYDRILVSEVAFVSLPGNAGWLGFRRVRNMNGKELPDAGPSLSALLTDGAQDDFDQARMLLAESARLNLGLPRSTNLPNLPLEFLHPRNRQRFTHRDDGREKIRDIETRRLVLQERSTPTLIQRPEGGDIPSLVSAWVEAATGRLIRAQVKSRDVRIGVPTFDAIIWVDFKEEPALKLLVPSEMKEEFYAGRFRDGTGTAKYSNYRKIKPM